MLEVVEAKPDVGDDELNHLACCETEGLDEAPEGEKALCGTSLSGKPSDNQMTLNCAPCKLIDEISDYCPRYGTCHG